MGITPFATGLKRRTISLMIGKAMNRKNIQNTLAIILALGSALGALPAAFAQGYSTYGPYPATPGPWTGSVAPVQPYVPSNLPNGLPVNTEFSPNYIGNGHTTTSYGDYRNPSVGYQIPTNNGQALTIGPTRKRSTAAMPAATVAPALWLSLLAAECSVLVQWLRELAP